MYGASDLTDQVESGATAVAAFVAIIALVTAFATYRSQTRQFKLQQKQLDDQSEVLDLQADDLREVKAERLRQRENEKRSQAGAVYLMREVTEYRAERGRIAHQLRVTVHNASNLPIRNLALTWTDVEGETTATIASQLAPHETAMCKYHGANSDPSFGGVSVVAHFRDAAGQLWSVATERGPEPCSEGFM